MISPTMRGRLRPSVRAPKARRYNDISGRSTDVTERINQLDQSRLLDVSPGSHSNGAARRHPPPSIGHPSSDQASVVDHNGEVIPSSVEGGGRSKPLNPGKGEGEKRRNRPGQKPVCFNGKPNHPAPEGNGSPKSKGVGEKRKIRLKFQEDRTADTNVLPAKEH